jgi:hypothetical protein
VEWITLFCANLAESYENNMDVLIHTGVRVLEGLFVVGWAGSVLVLLLSGVEDIRIIFEKDKPADRGPQE